MKPEFRIISQAGHDYCLKGLRRLAAAICKIKEKYVDDTVHRCKVSNAKGTTHKNEQQIP